jgi:hypothetical protein
MERTGLQGKPRSHGAGGRPPRQGGDAGRNHSNGGGRFSSDRNGNEAFSRGRSRGEGAGYAAPRRFEDRPAREGVRDGGYDNRPRRDDKPPVRIERKTRRSFDNSAPREDFGGRA